MTKRNTTLTSKENFNEVNIASVLQPFLLKPACKEYLWGGKKLIKEYGKKCDMESIAESWELSCHDGGISEIENGKHKGETLLSYIEKYGKATQYIDNIIK